MGVMENKMDTTIQGPKSSQVHPLLTDITRKQAAPENSEARNDMTRDPNPRALVGY